MTTFITKGSEVKGNLIEETATHYIVEIEEDQVSLNKEVTTIKESKEESVQTNSSLGVIKGLVVRTAKKIYIVKRNGQEFVRVYKTDSNGNWNRYYDVNISNLKGSSGLPQTVIEAIKQI